jgi:hypothetical protein
MRWWIVALPFCIGATPDPGVMLPTEIGVLSCTLRQAIDPQERRRISSALAYTGLQAVAALRCAS